MNMVAMVLSNLELCAGAGGQALGLEQAGFEHLALIENDRHAQKTLKLNRPNWNVPQDNASDLRNVDGCDFKGVDLMSGGLPCPPFSQAGKQLGNKDERDLFPDALRVASEANPKAILFENVKGMLDPIFSAYRADLQSKLEKLGYTVGWKLHKASDFGVSQLRPRLTIIAIKSDYSDQFVWPRESISDPPTVGQLLYSLMAERGWAGASQWQMLANDIAPTIVGGSKKHGGPDLGPTRAKRAWAALGVDGMGIADQAPEPSFVGHPKLTVAMVAKVQGFPEVWKISGRKTNAFRQVGNAFPPPVAKAVGESILKAVTQSRIVQVKKNASSMDNARKNEFSQRVVENNLN